MEACLRVHTDYSTGLVLLVEKEEVRDPRRSLHEEAGYSTYIKFA